MARNNRDAAKQQGNADIDLHVERVHVEQNRPQGSKRRAPTDTLTGRGNSRLLTNILLHMPRPTYRRLDRRDQRLFSTGAAST
jgi:hypothetical protein